MQTEKIKKIESIVLGGGCFWCLEVIFRNVRGIYSAISGYAGGSASHPTYKKVCGGKTGHAEVIKLEFDPEQIKLRDILEIFFTIHNPTTLNRQGNDIGTQYRSAIFFSDKEQKEIAENVIDELTKSQTYRAPLVTELTRLDKFYPAEEYHRRYFEKNPEKAYCQLVIAPKFEKFQKKLSRFLKA